MRIKWIFIFFLIFELGLFVGCKLPGSLRASVNDLVHSRNLSQEALSDIEHRDLENAELKLAKAVSVNNKDTDIRCKYAEILWERGKKQEAIDQLIDAAKITPKDSKIHLKIAEYCYEIGNFEAASDCATNAINRVTPENRYMIHRSWLVLAKIHRQKGDASGALAFYHKALSLDPANAEILMDLATFHETMNQPDRALVTWQTISRCYPPDQEPESVILGRGNAYLAMSRYDEATEQFLIAQKRWPQDTQIYCHLAQLRLLRGDISGAKVFADQAVALSPRDRRSLAMKQRIELAQNQGQSLR